MTDVVNPLLNLPLNTDKAYGMALTYNGCEVYIPVKVDLNTTPDVQIQTITKMQDKLRDYFISITPMPDQPAPLLA